jgi:hypothetical protein
MVEKLVALVRPPGRWVMDLVDDRGMLLAHLAPSMRHSSRHGHLTGKPAFHSMTGLLFDSILLLSFDRKLLRGFGKKIDMQKIFRKISSYMQAGRAAACVTHGDGAIPSTRSLRPLIWMFITLEKMWLEERRNRSEGRRAIATGEFSSSVRIGNVLYGLPVRLLSLQIWVIQGAK